MIIVDDEWLVRAALRVFLESADGFELVGEAENGADAVALVPLEPDADGYLVGAEEDGVWLNCAVLRLPADSPGLAILNRACTTPDEVPARVAQLVEERRRLERELAEAKRALASGGGGGGRQRPQKARVVQVRLTRAEAFEGDPLAGSQRSQPLAAHHPAPATRLVRTGAAVLPTRHGRFRAVAYRVGADGRVGEPA